MNEFTASDAKALAEQYKEEVDVSGILHSIKKVAEQGGRRLVVSKLEPFQEQKLRRLGYEVKYTSDIRPGESHYNITW